MPYEYAGLMARSWDLLRGDTSGWADRAFYLELVRRHGQPVPDVGCGTGRLLLDYMALGIDVDGVDDSPEMLALLGEKAKRLGLAPRVFAQRMARRIFEGAGFTEVEMFSGFRPEPVKADDRMFCVAGRDRLPGPIC